MTVGQPGCRPQCYFHTQGQIVIRVAALITMIGMERKRDIGLHGRERFATANPRQRSVKRH
jgi:hypothetical protein